jgi:orotate phosphoribosyltransferase
VITLKQGRLLELAQQYLLKGDFTFSAGQLNRCYFDGRALTLSAEGSLLVGELVWEIIAHLDVAAIGGPTLGAAPIVTATQIVAQLQGKSIQGFLVREETKAYGTQKLVEGHLPLRRAVAIVEDTVSTAGSVFHAINSADFAQCNIVKVVALLDWQLGGGKKLREAGYDFHPFLIGDLVTGKLSLWTPPGPL